MNIVPIKGLQFANHESFLEFHEPFSQNILKIAVFIATNLQNLTNYIQFSKSTYKI